MKYFLLQYDAENLGTFPQATDIISEYHFYWPNALHTIEKRKRIEKVVFPKEVKMHHKAKFTDYVSISFMSHPFMVISKQMFTIFKQFNMVDYSAQTIHLTKRTKSIEYVFFYSNYRAYGLMDFNKTKFACVDHRTESKTPIEINSSEEYINYKNKYLTSGFIAIQPPLFLNSFEGEPDLLQLPLCCLVTKYLVSERLKDALEEANMTGIDFKAFQPDLIKTVGNGIR